MEAINWDALSIESRENLLFIVLYDGADEQ